MQIDRRLLVDLVVLYPIPVLIAAYWATNPFRPPLDLARANAIPHIALVQSQACLLGIWAAYCRTQSWKRLAGLSLGALWLEILLCAPLENAPNLFLMPSTAAFGLALVLLAMRHWGTELLCPSDGLIPRDHGRLRFSIRSLMFCIAIGAFLAAWTRSVWADTSGWPTLVLNLVFGICFGALGLAALWAALGLTPPPQRVAFFLLCSAALGAILAFVIHASYRVEWTSVIPIFALLLLHFAILLGSLLIMRLCGFRLAVRPSLLESPTWTSPG
jgi:hypothetical protein